MWHSKNPFHQFHTQSSLFSSLSVQLLAFAFIINVDVGMYSCIQNWRWLSLKNTWLNTNTHRTDGVVLFNFIPFERNSAEKFNFSKTKSKIPAQIDFIYSFRMTFEYLGTFRKKLRFSKKIVSVIDNDEINTISQLATFYCRHDTNQGLVLTLFSISH